MYFKRTYQGRNIWDDPIIEKSQDQDQGQGQGQDQIKLRQRSALQQQMVLALTLTLVLTLDLAQITKLPLLNYLCSLLNLQAARLEKAELCFEVLLWKKVARLEGWEGCKVGKVGRLER